MSYSAYSALARLLPIPRNARPLSGDDLSQNFGRYADFFNAWWSDELQGKHLSADQQAVPAEKKAALKTLDGLNTTLLEPYPTLREEAIAQLALKADKTSIPYLILALQDPDTKVAYGAYSIVTRLTGLTASVADETAYAAGRDAANAPVYAWWVDELNGKHLPPATHSAPAIHR